MPWSLDDWQYLDRQVVTDPRGREWSVALMDVLGQPGDPEVPNSLLELQYASGRYCAIVYSRTGTMQFERAFATLADAKRAYERLLGDIFDGSVDPAQPVFRDNLDD